ncbi:hypothetical protein POPTR_010G041900v4 [Populus trichocarpa]|uniref:Uncharacterized protein n=1 Tax=Populus trichocarpa TaxID=3694 RepID=A0ACC0SAJ1_POPTR|nr:type 2 DNA topoisomerase 6 subunit B-like isoform X1 [Populus trichocarpa]KAI9386555.1 hypothetical protein POPTR_010G041900v4 [Populus trichocarpa]
MEISSTSNLCLHLISCAFQRCRLSQQLCRLSAVLKSPSPSILQISISDTGIGSCLEEFQDLNCSSIISAEFWDGILSVKTTAICDDEIYHYHFNLRENISSSRTLTRLPSNPKNGLKFSGTQICLSISESIDVLVSEINHFFQKMMILNIPNIAIELLIEREDIPGSRCENVFLANRSNPGPLSTSNVEFLKSGLEDYVLKHGNSLTQKCSTCFATSECLKVGSGIACSTESHKSSGLMMEVVIIISEIESTCPCFRECSSKTEVLYFKDFTPCSISHSTLNVLSTIDWKSYGLTLENVVDQGVCVLEWEDSPSHSQIDMVLHCYHKQYPMHKTQLERHLIKKAVKAALNNLKEKHPGILLSAHALKICSHAPDLARSIAGLILSSNDPDFQGECFSLLGLQSREIGADVVEDCIQEKIVSVIEMNDRKSRQRKVVAPFLFEDDCDQDSNYQDKEYEEGEDEFSYVD